MLLLLSFPLYRCPLCGSGITSMLKQAEVDVIARWEEPAQSILQICWHGNQP